jgi:hypothetical protein
VAGLVPAGFIVSTARDMGSYLALRGRPSRRSIALSAVVDVLVPALALLRVPTLAHADFWLLLVYAPDVGFILGGYAVLGLALALAKVVLYALARFRAEHGERDAREASDG